MINTIIANSNYLIGRALAGLVDELPEFNLVYWAENEEILQAKCSQNDVNLLIIDFTSENFSINAIQWVKRNLPKIQILSITALPIKKNILESLNAGAKSYVLNDCSRDEVIEAMIKTNIGKEFLCGKVFNELVIENSIIENKVSCDGINLTERESDIVKLIAEGNSNKQIADILSLSTHTINTHRKNIMAKLGVNNTAGLVMYCVKENLLGPNKFLFSGNN